MGYKKVSTEECCPLYNSEEWLYCILIRGTFIWATRKCPLKSAVLFIIGSCEEWLYCIVISGVWHLNGDP